jgi:hypothetical protein
LDAIVVSLERPVLAHQLVRNGFVRRFQRGFGIFVTPYEIERSPAMSTEQFLAGKPGIRIGPVVRQSGSGGDTQIMPRPDIGETLQIQTIGGGWCAPRLYLDGRLAHYDPMGGFTLSSMAPRADVVGIEVYRRPAEIPVEYSSGPGADCGVVLVWTIDGPSAGRAAGAGRSAGTAGGGFGGATSTLPEVGVQGPPPVAGERIRIQVAAADREPLGIHSPWEGTFVELREREVVATDPVAGRAIALPISGVEAWHVERLRPASHSYVRGAVAGSAVSVVTYGFLRILCRSVCDRSSASIVGPALAAGAFAGALVTLQGPGSEWVGAPRPGSVSVPSPTPGVGLSIRLRLGSR